MRIATGGLLKWVSRHPMVRSKTVLYFIAFITVTIFMLEFRTSSLRSQCDFDDPNFVRSIKSIESATQIQKSMIMKIIIEAFDIVINKDGNHTDFSDTRELILAAKEKVPREYSPSSGKNVRELKKGEFVKSETSNANSINQLENDRVDWNAVERGTNGNRRFKTSKDEPNTKDNNSCIVTTFYEIETENKVCVSIVKDVEIDKICPLNLHFIAYIHTAVKNWEKRRYIRNTWARVAEQRKYRFRIVFFIGMASLSEDEQTALTQEMTDHGDIVQASFIDNYRNMTVKGLTAMSWIEKNCAHIKYVMKLDDDVFANIPRITRTLSQHFGKYSSENPPFICYVTAKSTVLRDKSYKWSVSKEEYEPDLYPDYCFGWAYLLHMKTLFKLRRVALSAKYFWIDDAQFTGIVREIADIGIVDIAPAYQFMKLATKKVAYANLADFEKEFIYIFHWKTEVLYNNHMISFWN
ncbi:beta-1,3-galactosyltransferase 5-like [Tubulanus polymorphus]|uniref:beta-1,3-galactosyltransferase 5-like n=1 Tax=Tubulanus polymorphus TaxID=672921 RepID=UPI003DA4F75F